MSIDLFFLDFRNLALPSASGPVGRFLRLAKLLHNVHMAKTQKTVLSRKKLPT
jgi:hypothetical protein